MDKTITVEVSTYKTHPVYGKRVKYSKKFYAQVEDNSAKVCDMFQIAETRPLSRNKRFRLCNMFEKAVII